MANDLVTVGSYQFLHEAETARTLLESRGVRAFLADAEVVNTDWFLGNALGYIKLLVSTADAEGARAALQEIENRQAARSDEPEAEGVVCLACGVAVPEGQTACPACGWSYTDHEAEGQTEADGAGESASVMEQFRTLKRPVLLLLFSPVIVGFAAIGLLLLLGLIAWLIRAPFF